MEIPLQSPDSLGNSCDPLRFALISVGSLFGRSGLDVHQATFNEIAQSDLVEPLNRSEAVLPELSRIVCEHNVSLPTAVMSPYWNPANPYDPLEVWGTSVQYIDYHNEPLPVTTLPPEEDVQAYIDTIMNRPGRATLPEQFGAMLDVAKNDLLGALNIGFIASRLMARGLDRRAYPHIPSSVADMHAWNERISQFALGTDRGRNDGPGDTYYLWTHAFAGTFYSHYEGVGKRSFQFAFAHGTKIMSFVREYFAHTPLNTSHREASKMGRAAVFAIEDTLRARGSVRTEKIETFLGRHVPLMPTLGFEVPDLVRGDPKR